MNNNVMRLRNAIFGRSKPNQTLSEVNRRLRSSSSSGRDISTGGAAAAAEEGQQPPPPPSSKDSSSSVEKFFQHSGGSVYGRVMGSGKYTLKSDILGLLEGSCDLSLQDIKFEYNRIFSPIAMILQFPSPSAYTRALRIFSRLQTYRMEKVDPHNWEIQSFQGKTVLLQGLPPNAQIEDIERFLSGFECTPSNLQLFSRQGFSDRIRMALVHFPSQTHAMNAVLMKNKSFCLNNQILMRVLQ